MNINVRKLRVDLGMSQAEFAQKFGFSLGTLREWESERRKPQGPARVLLKVISFSPETVEAAIKEINLAA